MEDITVELYDDGTGYISDENGGYFFTKCRTIEATIASLSEDEVDRPSFSMYTAAEILREKLQ